MLTSVYNKVINDTIVTLCIIKSNINQQIVKTNAIFKLEYLKRLLHCYHIVMKADNDVNMDIKLYLALTNSSILTNIKNDTSNDTTNDTIFNNYLDNVTKMYIFITQNKEYEII